MSPDQNPDHAAQLERALEEIREAVKLLADRTYQPQIDIWIKLKTARMLLKDAEYLVERSLSELRQE
ncbi:MAG TPA: hypothetical protein V6C88_17960 [Chroococcidiopsis sp.]